MKREAQANCCEALFTPYSHEQGFTSFHPQRMTFLPSFHEKDAFEDCLRHAYTLVLLCDGPEQEDRVKPRCIADSWYERRPESRLRHFAYPTNSFGGGL